MTDAALKASSKHLVVAPAPVLLTDDQVIEFVIKGYLILEPRVEPAVHAWVCKEFDQNGIIPVDLEHDPLGLTIYNKAPSLKTVFDDPVVVGATLSLMGPDYFIFGRYCHDLRPRHGGAGWHQDDCNVRHYQVRRLMVLYYPQEVTPDIGPTYVVPGTHLLNCPTDRMSTFGNFRHQLPLVVKAGTIVITHYDIWHSASFNKSDKMRYLVKYYVDRTHEPTQANWTHDPAKAIPIAMDRMHHATTFGFNHELYKERHLRWRLYSYLLGKTDQPAVWAGWEKLRPDSPKLGGVDWDRIQGYIGSPMV